MGGGGGRKEGGKERKEGKFAGPHFKHWSGPGWVEPDQNLFVVDQRMCMGLRRCSGGRHKENIGWLDGDSYSLCVPERSWLVIGGLMC